MENHHPAQARLPAGGEMVAHWTGVARNRSPWTAVLGGWSIASARTSAAALNGTAMKGKP